MAELSKREIRKEARELMANGMSKQEAYEELVKRHKLYIQIADIIENVPHPNAKKKYGWLNAILLSIFSLFALLDLLTLSIISAVIDGLFIWIVAGYYVHRYSWIIVRGVISVIAVIGVFVSGNQGTFEIVFSFIDLGIAITVLLLGISLQGKLCPDPEIKKEIYVNKQGQKRTRNLYLFADV